jgi:perosamine synthetase
VVPEQNRVVRLARPSVGPEALESIGRILRTGYLVQGEQVDRFERAMEEYLGNGGVAAVSSGTAALHLALMAVGVKAGTAVLVPAFTFPSTANVVEQLGAEVRFVDVDPGTFNISIRSLSERHDERCSALVPVHLFGVPADMEPVISFARRAGMAVVEDAACALGASSRGAMCGTIGDAGCFSFHPRKIMTTGEGGLVVSRRRDVVDAVRRLRDPGLSAGAGGRDLRAPGLNYRMSELHAAVGLDGVKRLRREIEARGNLADRYIRRLASRQDIRLQEAPPGASRVYQAFVIVLEGDRSRDEVTAKLREAGVESTIGTYGVHLLSYYRSKYGLRASDLPAASRLFERTVTLPLHSGMNETDVDFVVDRLEEILA